MTQIRDLLVNRLVVALELGMKTSIPRGDPTRVDLVKAYRFQADPLDTPVYMYVTAGDPSNLAIKDGRISTDDMQDLRMSIPTGEIGGGHMWWRRGTVNVNCYFIAKKYTQDVAARHAQEILGRATSLIETTTVADLVDSFGERALLLIPYSNVFFEGGGPPDQYIWRGWVEWQALTARP